MSQSEIIAHLSIIDGEIAKIEAEKLTLQKESDATKLKISTDEKKLAALQKALDTAEADLKTNSALMDNEAKQFSQRERQLMEMGGAKSAKHLGSENDRATLVIEDLQKKINAAKETVSQAETNYLSFEEALSVTKSRSELRQKDIVSKTTSLDGRKKQLVEQRAPLAAELAPEISSTYDKLRHKHPDPATTIDDGSCATCNTNISLRISNSVKSGTPEICPGCHRFLVATLAVGAPAESQELI